MTTETRRTIEIEWDGATYRVSLLFDGTPTLSQTRYDDAGHRSLALGVADPRYAQGGPLYQAVCRVAWSLGAACEWPRPAANVKWRDVEEEAHGLMFDAWLRAAGREDSASYDDLRAAWRAGEDPADYRP